MEITSLLNKVKKLRDKEQNLKEARKILETHLKKFSNRNEKLLLLKNLAKIYLDLGLIKSSEKCFKKAISLAEELNDELNLADLLRKYGYFVNKYHRNGAKEGLKYCEKSLKICEIFKDNKKFLKIKTSALAAKGNIFSGRRNYKEASKIYQEALNLAKRIKFLEREITLIGDIANVYIWGQNRDFKKAEKLLKEMLLKSALYYKHSLPAALFRLGELKLLERKLEEAQMWAEISLIVAQHGNWKREEAEVLELIGKIFREKNLKSQAENYFKKALKIYQKLGYHSKIKFLKKEMKLL